MSRRKTPPGSTTAVAFHVRTDGGPWRAADPSDPSLSRAKRGRQWRARCRLRLEDGTMTQLSRSAQTPSLAQSALERVVDHERRSFDADDAVPTLGDLIAWAVERIESGRDPQVKSPNSVSKYLGVARLWAGRPSPADDADSTGARSHIRRAKPQESRVHGIPIDQLTPADLSDELERVAELGAGSLTHLRALWRKATARGIALRYITVDPAVNLRVPATTISPETHTYKNGASRPLKNSLTNEQLATLREKVRIRHPQQRLDVTDLIILGTYTGLRINEPSSLRWVDVHLGDERSFLTVRGQVYGSGKTREWRPMLKRDSSRRTVPLPPAAAEMLRARQRGALDAQLQGASPGAAFVFPAQRGGLPDQTAARKAVRRKLDRAGFPWVTFHTLRRTVERQLMDAGVDPRVIMSVMGHDPATSWASYVDSKSVDVDVAASVLK